MQRQWGIVAGAADVKAGDGKAYPEESLLGEVVLPLMFDQLLQDEIERLGHRPFPQGDAAFGQYLA